VEGFKEDKRVVERIAEGLVKYMLQLMLGEEADAFDPRARHEAMVEGLKESLASDAQRTYGEAGFGCGRHPQDL
jgi:hypothetical protein